MLSVMVIIFLLELKFTLKIRLNKDALIQFRRDAQNSFLIVRFLSQLQNKKNGRQITVEQIFISLKCDCVLIDSNQTF